MRCVVWSVAPFFFSLSVFGSGVFSVPPRARPSSTLTRTDSGERRKRCSGPASSQGEIRSRDPGNRIAYAVQRCF